MRKQASRVLAHLQCYGSDTDSNMALVLGIPAPSIRRSIQELQDEGYHISYAGANGEYTLPPEGGTQ